MTRAAGRDGACTLTLEGMKDALERLKKKEREPYTRFVSGDLYRKMEAAVVLGETDDPHVHMQLQISGIKVKLKALGDKDESG